MIELQSSSLDYARLRQAGRDVLSLALIDARNRSLAWATLLEDAPGEVLRLGGEMWGHFVDGRVDALCHAGANLVPVQAGPDAQRAFADRARRQGRRCASIVGPRAAVAPMLAPKTTTGRSPALLFNASNAASAAGPIRASRAGPVLPPNPG